MLKTVLLLLRVIGLFAYSPLLTPNAAPTGWTAQSSELSRRNLLASAAIASSTFWIGPAKSLAADNLMEYKDDGCKFSLKVPSDWDQTVQELPFPDRRKIVLFIKPNSNQKTLLFVAYTPVRDDFTSLGSFGSIDQVSKRNKGYDLAVPFFSRRS